MVFRSSRYSPGISHLAYADDILVFTQASSVAMRRLRECLDKYTAISGQLVNLNKSNFYIAEKHEDWANSIRASGGFAQGTFPFIYLGVPIFRGVKRSDLFLFVRDTIAKRIQGWAHRHLSFGGRLTLIKSTLKALPIHIFQSLEPTAEVIKILEQQLARFFWGSALDRKRTHWISWDQICLPTSEGGLGVRKFDEVIKAFSLKLWWRFREQQSLWATFMMQKYGSKRSPLTTPLPGNCSPTWRRLMRIWSSAHPHIRWVLGDGSVFFWDDIWLEDTAIRELCLDDRGSPQTTIADFWHNGGWSEPKLQTLQAQSGLPQQIVDKILDTPILEGRRDTPRWMRSSNGNFTLSSAWELGRSRRPRVPLLTDIWNKSFTSSISIFLWRLISNRIPVDTKIQWRGILLASKCWCCDSAPNIESLNHLFVSGHGVMEVWKEFDRWFPGSANPLRLSDSIPDRLQAWARRTGHSDRNHLSRIVPGLIFWFVWAERNNCRHNGERFKAHNVIWQAAMYIKRLVCNSTIGRAQWNGCSPSVDLGNPPARRRIQPYIPIKWQPPDESWLKINVASWTDEAQDVFGGGIVRDHNGDLLLAFRTAISPCSSIEADFWTILFGLKALDRPSLQIRIESHSQHAVTILKSGGLGPAHLRNVIAKIMQSNYDVTRNISVIPCAGNRIACLLAKGAFGDESNQLFSELSAPNLLKATVRLEQIGLPNLVGVEGNGNG